MTTGVKQHKRLIVWQLKDAQGREVIEPLTMLINPINLNIGYTHIRTEVRTKGGFAVFYWGQEIDNVSASGRTAMFYGDDYTTERGITIKYRKQTEAFENFRSLFEMYKNNGKFYQQNLTRIESVGTVTMTFMSKEYEGYFESFSVKEIAEQPFTLEYDFTFKVMKTIGDNVISDGKYLAGGS